ncbi:MAG: hypothetical protein QXK15_00690, partial [Candidatus Bathyarchaeia archaeon]
GKKREEEVKKEKTGRKKGSVDSDSRVEEDLTALGRIQEKRGMRDGPGVVDTGNRHRYHL